MYFPPKGVLDDLRAFEAMPSTPEKDEIKRQFLAEEIGNFDFYSKVWAYMNSKRGG